MLITKRDGRQEEFNADRINAAINQACHGLNDIASKVTQIAAETSLTLYDGITSQELDQAVIQSAAQNIQDDPDFDRIAERLLAKTIYKEVIGKYQNLTDEHALAFIHYIQNSSNNILDERLNKIFDLSQLATALQISNDDLLTYTGLSTMSQRYLIKDSQGKLLETPQFFWMRVAMGMSLNEKNPNESAIAFYQKMSALEYIPGGSTNINAGTKKPRLSNCYLMDMDDSIDSIGKTVSDVMKLSKATGGIGLNTTRLRAAGSTINTNNTKSSGPIPFLHIIDSTIRAISRAGKKMGALAFYMENWHLDFDEFLDLKQNAGDEYRRTRTANTACYLSDEFMRRVEADEDWYLFDPKETSDLIELYGPNFSKRYDYYCQEAEKGKLDIYKKIKAREQWRKIIVSLTASAHPWITFKDAINLRALNNNTGTIHSSNLCTEITLPQDSKNISVCNLLSLNLSRHINNHNVDWDKLAQSTRLAIRQLDNLVDINEAPIPEAINFDRANRALGLGIMGLADTFEKLQLPYESTEAADLTDEILEFISYEAISESAKLAQEKGSYQAFVGSGWSKGELPIDTLKNLEIHRGQKLNLNDKIRLDWEKLRQQVKQGMRNSTLLAIAPTANIGLVAGTSTGIDPRFAQVFSRNTLSGKYLDINFNLVEDLKNLNIWDDNKDKILAAYGNLSGLENIPEKLKNLYKDSFSTPAEAFIEIAARAQKWVDQAISRNMYLETRDIDYIMELYLEAWRKGLKTTYYLHIKPRHSAEQSTIKINKASSLGKKGFGAIQTEIKACPIDPMERLACESCQ